MQYLIKTCNLSKTYKMKKAVDSVNLHVKKGEVYGFVGPNGAGKSTILKMLLNLVKPDSGSIEIFGKKTGDINYEILKRIGSIIENPYFYDSLTGKENLELHCEYMGYHNRESINEVLKTVSLSGVEEKNVSQYSLGMKQRLAIARAIITKPELLILDEPINALDPEGIREMRELFRRLNKDWGTTIIISSHILSEMELIADTVGLIKSGKLLSEISMEEIYQYNTQYTELEVEDTARAGYLLEEKMGVVQYKIISENIIRIFDESKTGRDISTLFAQNHLGIETIRKKQSTLEDYFFQLMEEA